MKGSSLDLVLQRIENNLNYIHHRILTCTPEQLISNYSSFDPLRRSSDLDLDYVRGQIEAAAKLSLERRNKGRTAASAISMGDEVYRKKFSRSNKLDRLWLGPYMVISVNENNPNRVTIRGEIGTEMVNIKHLKRALRGVLQEASDEDDPVREPDGQGNA